jgi:hypothetical protein
MKAKFLVLYNHNDGVIDASCISAGVFRHSDAEQVIAAKGIKNALQEFLDMDGIEYVSNFYGGDDWVNCPDGEVLLPIDIWHCKFSKKPCTLQARIYFDGHSRFLEKCSAPEKNKHGIYKAAIEGRYKGFHHLPGRHLCPMCEWVESANVKKPPHGSDYYEDEEESKVSPYWYHYRFQLTLLDSLLEMVGIELNEELRIELLRLGLPGYVTYCGLCPTCMMLTVGRLDRKLAERLEIIEMEFFRPS